MQRVAVYVDGFNLYFGLKEAGFKRYYWLDVAELARNLLKPGQALEAVHYFSARIRSNGRNTQDRERQNTYLEALETQDVQCQYGHYIEKKRQCRKCQATWQDYEEKMTDVNIAIQLLEDAMDDRFDMALLITGDSDLVTPIQRIRQRASEKRIIVAFPPKRSSNELKRCANGFLNIGEDKLRASQLPSIIKKPDGFELIRPSRWK
jgi:uncharacterized LabA/DUF88 family protein